MLNRLQSSAGTSCSGRTSYAAEVHSRKAATCWAPSRCAGLRSLVQRQRAAQLRCPAAAAAPPAQDVPEQDAEGPDSEEEVFPTIKLNLPPPTKTKIKKAEYMQSCVAVSACPAPRFPEFAVIGRSNVGKSSLINMLTGRKDLAMVSKEPGKTKCINHFIINDSWYLVDLPGYGFAKVGQQGRETFNKFTREYFKQRLNLAMVFLLVDGSIPPQKIDLQYANWLTDNEVPFVIVFTKVDKRRKGAEKPMLNVDKFKRALLQDLAYLPPSVVTSSTSGIGKSELLQLIASLRVAYEKSGRLQAIRMGAFNPSPAASEGISGDGAHAGAGADLAAT